LGGEGNDVLDGGAGNDFLRGDAGSDVFVFGRGYGQDTVNWLEAGLDKIDLRGFGATSLDALAKMATITAGTLASGAPSVTLDFGNGDRLLVGGIGKLSAEHVILAEGGGEVPPPTQPPGSPLTGTDAADTLVGTANDDEIQGKGGDDVLRGEGGNDTLDGGVGHDQLFGGAGNDVLDGGAGNDFLRGDVGADVFVFGRDYGHDIVNWFEGGRDKVDLQAFGLGGANDLAKAATVTSGTFDTGAPFVTLDFGGGDRLTIAGIAKLAAENVIF
jgi:Ca2+-binding RTX toxin-like protein